MAMNSRVLMDDFPSQSEEVEKRNEEQNYLTERSGSKCAPFLNWK